MLQTCKIGKQGDDLDEQCKKENENDSESDIDESGDSTDEEDRDSLLIEGNPYNHDDGFINGKVTYLVNKKHLTDKQFKHGNKVKCEDCHFISWNMKDLYRHIRKKHEDRLFVDNDKYENI